MGGELQLNDFATTAAATAPSASYTKLITVAGIPYAKSPTKTVCLWIGATFDVGTYGATGDGTTDDTSAINSAIAAAVAWTGGFSSQRGAKITFPAGVFKVTSSLTTVNANGIIFEGTGRGASTILVNHATGDVIGFTAGNEFCEVRNLQFFNGVTRTAGSYIATNGAHDIIISDFAMTGAFVGITISGASIKVSVRDGTIDSTVATTGVAILITNGAAGDTYVGPNLVLSNPGGAKPLAGIRIKQSGHFKLSGVNCTSCDIGLLIDPDTSQDVTYGFVETSLFDSCGTNAMKINPANAASARVRSLKFVDSWFSGAGTAAGAFLTSQGASAVVSDITFAVCRFLNNGTHGLQHAFGTDVAVVAGCTFAGNSAASSGVSDGINVAAAVSDWRVTDCALKPTGTATNTQRYGISVAAGASNNYVIVANDVRGNVTGGVDDGGTGTTKTVRDNIGSLLKGAIATLSAPSAGISTEAVVLNVSIPANSVRVGQVFRLSGTGITSLAGTVTFRVRAGAAGTTGDNQAWVCVTSAAQATNQRQGFEAYLTVRSIGAGGTVQCEGMAYAGTAVLPTVVAAVATAAVATTAAWFIDITAVCATTGTITMQQACIEAL